MSWSFRSMETVAWVPGDVKLAGGTADRLRPFSTVAIQGHGAGAPGHRPASGAERLNPMRMKPARSNAYDNVAKL